MCQVHPGQPGLKHQEAAKKLNSPPVSGILIRDRRGKVLQEHA
jgi:hypothetical protein